MLNRPINKPVINFFAVHHYNFIWNDVGINSNQTVSTWEPRVPTGGKMLGHYAQREREGHLPTEPTYVIESVEKNNDSLWPAYANPIGYDNLWFFYGLGVWFPLAPDGYVACGVGVTHNYYVPGPDKPINNLVCLREDLAERIDKSQLQPVWNDNGSKHDQSVSFWKINNLNSITATNTWDPPTKAIYTPKGLL